MRQLSRLGYFACAGLLTLALSGCGEEPTHPSTAPSAGTSDTLKVLNPPTQDGTWKQDLERLEAITGRTFVPGAGGVATSPANDASGAGTVNATAWSHALTGTNPRQACEDLVTWVQDAAEALPARATAPAERTPPAQYMTENCVQASATPRDHSRSPFEVFLTYPAGSQGTVQYSIWAAVDGTGDNRALTAVAEANKAG
jgi:hypothetical protein